MTTSAARDALGDSLLEPGTLVASRFRVAHVIGRGGMGAVYEAEDVVIGRAVALKVLTVFEERALDRFLGEARAASRISSRHVSAVHDFGHDPQHGSYIVMELLQGEPLDQVLSRRGSLTPAVAAAVGADIAEALAAAHAAGVVHRDLKPSNVWMLRDGGLKVIDFGIARVVDARTADGSAPDRTAPDVILGTPLYISPEAVRGDDVGPAADLYALGVMLFEMATGSAPFWDEVPVALCTKHLRDPPPALSAVRPDLSLPEGYVALVAGLLEKDPKRRPRSAREVADLLRPMCDPEGPLRLAGDGGAAGAPTATIPRPRSRFRLLVAVAVGVPALVALAVMGVVASGLAGDEESPLPAVDPAAPLVALPNEPAPPEPPPARASVPSTIRIDLRVTPPGATIQLDGEAATPPFELANDGAEHALTITRAGYSSEQRILRADRDQSLEIVLRRRPRRRPLPAKLREW